MIACKYLYLIALARQKHFGRAAEACHVYASTLSAAIRDIESELGVTVVERGQQFSGLTPEGERVLDCARQLAGSPGRCIGDAVVADTVQRIAHLRATPEAREGVAAFLEKRTPDW